MSAVIDRQSAGGTPLVSIVMPSFNQASFIAAAAKSVLLQSFANLELIVADGGSTDGTLQEQERLPCESAGWLKWYSEHDDGAADAINKALKLARGEYIGWLNTDDLYADDAIQWALSYFAKHPSTFSIEIGLPTIYSSSAYWSFMIRTEGAFVPAESERNSDDGRARAFMVDKIELEQEVGSCS